MVLLTQERETNLSITGINTNSPVTESGELLRIINSSRGSLAFIIYIRIFIFA
jgi:hypothetical protein